MSLPELGCLQHKASNVSFICCVGQYPAKFIERQKLFLPDIHTFINFFKLISKGNVAEYRAASFQASSLFCLFRL